MEKNCYVFFRRVLRIRPFDGNLSSRSHRKNLRIRDRVHRVRSLMDYNVRIRASRRSAGLIFSRLRRRLQSREQPDHVARKNSTPKIKGHQQSCLIISRSLRTFNSVYLTSNFENFKESVSVEDRHATFTTMRIIANFRSLCESSLSLSLSLSHSLTLSLRLFASQHTFPTSRRSSLIFPKYIIDTRDISRIYNLFLLNDVLRVTEFPNVFPPVPRTPITRNAPLTARSASHTWTVFESFVYLGRPRLVL